VRGVGWAALLCSAEGAKRASPASPHFNKFACGGLFYLFFFFFYKKRGVGGKEERGKRGASPRSPLLEKKKKKKKSSTHADVFGARLYKKDQKKLVEKEARRESPLGAKEKVLFFKWKGPNIQHPFSSVFGDNFFLSKRKSIHGYDGTSPLIFLFIEVKRGRVIEKRGGCHLQETCF
jgi:hypothetical protein